MPWLAPPRFHRRGVLIVLHVGDRPQVHEALVAIFGPPFAGAPVRP